MTDEGLEVTVQLAEIFEESDLLEIGLSDNAMGPRGLLRVESLFANSHLQRLYLSNCGLSFESMEMLKKSLVADDGRIANSMSELVLDRNMMGVDGARVVGEFLPLLKKLEYFSYQGCRPTDVGTKFLCEGILGLTKECQPVLRRIDMEDCTFGETEDDAIFPFSEALKKCPQLTYLNIIDGAIELEGLELLLNALKIARVKLSHLYLDGSGELGSDGARALADFLVSQATSIVSLHLNYCELGDEGVSILLEPFSASKQCLQELSLNCNEIGEEGGRALVRAMLPNLTKLHLEENEDELPKKYLRSIYGDGVIFGEDDEDDEEEADMSDDMENLIGQFSAARI